MPVLKNSKQKEKPSLESLKASLPIEASKAQSFSVFKIFLALFSLGMIVEGYFLYGLDQRISFLEKKLDSLLPREVFQQFPKEEVIEPLLKDPIPLV